MKILLFVLLLACISSNPYHTVLTVDNYEQIYKEIQEKGTNEEKLRSEKIFTLKKIRSLRGKTLAESLSGKSFEEHAQAFKNRKKE